MLEKDIRVLRLRSVVSVWIHHGLAMRQLLRQEEGVDRADDAVLIPMCNQSRHANLTQHSVPVPRGYGTPLAGRFQLERLRFA